MSEQIASELPAGTSILAIGLMSGTSQDGVDVALIDTDGEHIAQLGLSRGAQLARPAARISRHDRSAASLDRRRAGEAVKSTRMQLVIARSAATKQSSRCHKPGLLRFARNDDRIKTESGRGRSRSRCVWRCRCRRFRRRRQASRRRQSSPRHHRWRAPRRALQQRHGGQPCRLGVIL
jgi:hypothetical protein